MVQTAASFAITLYRTCNCLVQALLAMFDTQGGWGVLRISSDGDDQRIFLGLKFSIPGFYGVRKFGIVLGSLVQVGIFGGY